MRSVLSTFLTIALTVLMSLGSSLTVSMPAEAGTMAPLPIAALPGVGAFTAGTRPDDIGVTEGKLLSCPASPNCVVSQDGDAEHAIAPIKHHVTHFTHLPPDLIFHASQAF